MEQRFINQSVLLRQKFGEIEQKYPSFYESNQRAKEIRGKDDLLFDISQNKSQHFPGSQVSNILEDKKTIGKIITVVNDLQSNQPIQAIQLINGKNKSMLLTDFISGIPITNMGEYPFFPPFYVNPSKPTLEGERIAVTLPKDSMSLLEILHEYGHAFSDTLLGSRNSYNKMQLMDPGFFRMPSGGATKEQYYLWAAEEGFGINIDEVFSNEDYENVMREEEKASIHALEEYQKMIEFLAVKKHEDRMQNAAEFLALFLNSYRIRLKDLIGNTPWGAYQQLS